MNWKYQTLLHTFSAIDFCLGLIQSNEAPLCHAIKTTCSLCSEIQKKIQKRSSVLYFLVPPLELRIQNTKQKRAFVFVFVQRLLGSPSQPNFDFILHLWAGEQSNR
mmetsp:Transcript_976/g.1548  ORF Transcript_976/g.1548 Transcript_976/m.1548 type:complete len:106 (-) Transcript_976:182-499(-)